MCPCLNELLQFNTELQLTSTESRYLEIPKMSHINSTKSAQAPSDYTGDSAFHGV